MAVTKCQINNLRGGGIISGHSFKVLVSHDLESVMDQGSSLDSSQEMEPSSNLRALTQDTAPKKPLTPSDLLPPTSLHLL